MDSKFVPALINSNSSSSIAQTSPPAHPNANITKKQATPPSKKYHNKTPQSRGNGSANTKRTEIIEKIRDSVDIDESQHGGTRKKNLNHLLSFKFAARPKVSPENITRTTKQFNNLFTKEQYLQANCHFMVSSGADDYSVHFSDPDKLVEWQRIEEVIVSSCVPLTCPICLDEPIAPKITKCGHIYCWPCILHYLALGENAWRKCPICFESIYKADLKSVQAIRVAEIKPGDEIELNLMFKQKLSTLIFPVSAYETINKLKPKVLDDFRQADFGECLSYMKMQVADAAYVREKTIIRERDALKTLLAVECDLHSAPFVHEALNLLNERELALGRLSEVGKGEKSEILAESETKLTASGINAMSLENVVSYKDAFEAEEEVVEVVKSDVSESGAGCSSIEAEDFGEEDALEVEGEVSDTANAVIEVNDELFQYFYQAADGQRIYLSSLNFRCLMSEFKTIAKCPAKIRARIVATENQFMNDELRKRFKYLSHLPLHSEFQIVELDLKEPLLSKETLKLYEKEIEAKRQMRAKKEAFETRRLKKMMSLMEDKKFYTNYSAMDERSVNAMPKVESVIDYSVEFPTFEDARAVPSRQSSSETPVVVEAKVQKKDKKETMHHSCSYSQMVRVENKTSDTAWPKVSSGKVQETGSAWPAVTAVSWPPKQNVTPAASGARVKTSSISTDECEDGEPIRPPGYKESFFDAIDLALKNVKKGSKAEADEQPTQTKQQDKKKKKKSAMLLFST